MDPGALRPGTKQEIESEPTGDQAIHLARLLLAAAQDWKAIDVTAYRLEKRQSDNTYHITVTSAD